MNQPPPPGGWGPPGPPGPPMPPQPLGPPGGWGVGLPPGVDPMIGAGGPGGGPGYGSQQEPMAIISLTAGIIAVPMFGCCGLLSLGFAVIGLVLGFVSLTRIKNEPDRYTGKPLAIAGLAINAVMAIVTVLLMIFTVGIMGLGILTSP